MDTKSNYFIYFAGLSVNFLAFGAGSAYSWTSPMLPKLTDPDQTPLPYVPTISDQSWIASLTSLGALVGPIGAGFLSEKIGRKKTLLLSALPMIISHLIIAFANSLTLYFVARFLVGIGAGCVYSVMPNYVGDISEDKNRGALGCFMTLMITNGLLFNYLIGPFVSIWVLSMGNIIPILIFILTFWYFVPESPYFYVNCGNREAAEASLVKLRGKTDVQKELLKVVDFVDTSKNCKGGIKEMFKSRALVRGLIISNALMVIQQFSGINAVLGFMETIFRSAGSTIPAEYSSIIVGVVQVFTVLISTQLMDRFGKKFFLLISTVGSFLSLTALGLYFYLKNNDYNVDPIFWLPLVSLISYIILFNLGLSSVPWAIMGEIFPINLKSAASTVTTTFCLTLAFLITMFFPPISVSLGMAGSFWVFAGICALGSIFVYFYVPETKGKSFQEIQEMLGAEKH